MVGLSRLAGVGTEQLTVPTGDRMESRVRIPRWTWGSHSKDSMGAVGKFQGSRWDLAIQAFSPEQVASRTEFCPAESARVSGARCSVSWFFAVSRGSRQSHTHHRCPELLAQTWQDPNGIHCGDVR